MRLYVLGYGESRVYPSVCPRVITSEVPNGFGTNLVLQAYAKVCHTNLFLLLSIEQNLASCEA